MDIGELHSFLGKLIDKGVDTKIKVATLVDGIPWELYEAHMVVGPFRADPAPKLSAFTQKDGPMLLLEPLGEDVSDLLNPGQGIQAPEYVRLNVKLD